jgi:cold shock CspA family protein
MEQSREMPIAETVTTVVSDSNEIHKDGQYTGQCKWFNDKLGYGFVTICSGDEKGKDIFVHHSGVKPLNSNYKTLRKGEYIQFNIINGMNGLQAVDVTGFGGGPLMCDFVSTKRVGLPHVQPPPPPPPRGDNTQWQTVTRKPSKYDKPRGGGAGTKRSYKDITA